MVFIKTKIVMIFIKGLEPCHVGTVPVPASLVSSQASKIIIIIIGEIRCQGWDVVPRQLSDHWLGSSSPGNGSVDWGPDYHQNSPPSLYGSVGMSERFNIVFSENLSSRDVFFKIQQNPHLRRC